MLTHPQSNSPASKLRKNSSQAASWDIKIPAMAPPIQGIPWHEYSRNTMNGLRNPSAALSLTHSPSLDVKYTSNFMTFCSFVSALTGPFLVLSLTHLWDSFWPESDLLFRPDSFIIDIYTWFLTVPCLYSIAVEQNAWNKAVFFWSWQLKNWRGALWDLFTAEVLSTWLCLMLLSVRLDCRWIPTIPLIFPHRRSIKVFFWRIMKR